MADSPGGSARITMEDLFALRFYLENEQYDRVEAEIRRLRAIDPDWQVPDDLLTGTFGPDEGRVWTALSADGADAADRALEALRAEYPTFQPSQELQDEIRRTRSQERMLAAMDNADWQAVIGAAEASPDIITCGRVDNVWNLAEAYARLGQRDNASTVWRQAIELCGHFEIAVATIDKADAFLAQSQLDTLIERAVATVGREDGFADLRDRLVAGREAGVGGPDAQTDGADIVGDGDRDPEPSVATPAPSAPRDLAGAPDGAGAETPAATTAPAAAPATDTNLPAASAAAERQDYARCLALTRNAASASALLVRGWCLYELERPTEAQFAFAEVQALTENAEERMDAEFGEILSMLRRQLVGEAEQRMVTANLTEAFETDISAEILAQRAILAYEAGLNQRALVLIDARRSLAPDRRDLSVIEGFALYNLNRLAEADSVFRRLDRELSTPESREGLRIVRAGRE